MKRVLRPPRYLPEVLQAISELKETGGSNTNKIVNHIKAGTNNRSNIYAKPRDLTTQIRRALNHGVSNGIVQHRAGKYRLNAKIVDPLRDCAECRRRERERRRRKGRHGRKRSRHHRSHSLASVPSDRFESDSDTDFYERPRRHRDRRRPHVNESFEDVPIQEARRRKKKSGGKKRRRRSRHGRQHKTVDVLSPIKSEHELEKEMSIDNPVYPDDHFGDGDDQMHDLGRVECDNPDCLCNVKEEIEENQNSDESM